MGRGTEPAGPRVAAAQAVTQVLEEGRTLSEVLPEAGRGDPRDAALARAIAFGVLRHAPRLQARLDGYLRKPLKPRDGDIRAVLLGGLYQLGWMRMPAYAAIDASVEACKALNKPWATGLVNGILRRYQRDGTPTEAPEGAPAHVAADHPAWLYASLQQAWPEALDAVLASNNAHPPMWLRVNRIQGDRDAYRASLADAELPACPGRHSDDALCLEQAVDVAQLPGFDQGRVSVQDAAAQLAAGLLDPQPGQRVLDACAAPGGKTAHLLELDRNLSVTAVEVDPRRADRIGPGLHRLGLEAEVVVADAGAPDQWWDGKPFQRILLDAPCSATGVIRRHPDIKSLRRAEDIPQLAAQQSALLDQLWPLLAPEGRLLYATCSILPAENDAVLGAFLAEHPDARWVELEGDWGRATEYGRQILPGEDAMDGFYYGLLEKIH